MQRSLQRDCLKQPDSLPIAAVNDGVRNLARHVVSLNEGRDIFSRTALHELSICVRSSPTEPMPCIYPLSLIVVMGGTQSVSFDENMLSISAGNAIITSFETPVTSHVSAADAQTPYASVRVELPRDLIQECISDVRAQPADAGRLPRTRVFPLSMDLLGAIERLIRLAEDADAVRRTVLSRLVLKEIIVRILTGEHRDSLLRLYARDSFEHKIQDSLTWLNQHFAQKVEIEKLARSVGMSPSSFRRHFKELTGISPLQYQKQLKLQEARQLMRERDFKALDAAVAVGYESPQQFSREYTRLFGASPKRDIHRLRTQGEIYGRIT